VKKSISTSNVEGLYSAITKDRAKSVSELDNVPNLDPTQVETKTLSNQNVADCKKKAEKGKPKTSSNEVIVPTKVANVYKPPPPVDDDYDSDFELMLDPGYAECADAIKGNKTL